MRSRSLRAAPPRAPKACRPRCGSHATHRTRRTSPPLSRGSTRRCRRSRSCCTTRATARGAFVDLSPDDVRRSLDVSAFGAFLVAQHAARRMLARGRGALLFTGASASVKGYAKSAPFAMGKFALRGLAQSLARELAPQGIHVAHFVIDGQVRAGDADAGDARLDPDAIASTYLHVLRQPRSAWTWEVELRPWVEPF